MNDYGCLAVSRFFNFPNGFPGAVAAENIQNAGAAFAFGNLSFYRGNALGFYFSGRDRGRQSGWFPGVECVCNDLFEAPRQPVRVLLKHTGGLRRTASLREPC